MSDQDLNSLRNQLMVQAKEKGFASIIYHLPSSKSQLMRLPCSIEDQATLLGCALRATDQKTVWCDHRKFSPGDTKTTEAIFLFPGSGSGTNENRIKDAYQKCRPETVALSVIGDADSLTFSSGPLDKNSLQITCREMFSRGEWEGKLTAKIKKEKDRKNNPGFADTEEIKDLRFQLAETKKTISALTEEKTALAGTLAGLRENLADTLKAKTKLGKENKRLGDEVVGLKNKLAPLPSTPPPPAPPKGKEK